MQTHEIQYVVTMAVDVHDDVTPSDVSGEVSSLLFDAINTKLRNHVYDDEMIDHIDIVDIS
jgi:hypothetical protein